MSTTAQQSTVVMATLSTFLFPDLTLHFQALITTCTCQLAASTDLDTWEYRDGHHLCHDDEFAVCQLPAPPNPSTRLIMAYYYTTKL